MSYLRLLLILRAWFEEGGQFCEAGMGGGREILQITDVAAEAAGMKRNRDHAQA